MDNKKTYSSTHIKNLTLIFVIVGIGFYVYLKLIRK